MSGIRHVFLLLVCLGSIGLPWQSPAGQGRGSERGRAPLSPAAAVVSGISVSRAESASPPLRVEVCGPEGTRLRQGFSLVFELRAPVRGLVVRNGDTGLAVGATAEGQRATGTLSPGSL